MRLLLFCVLHVWTRIASLWKHPDGLWISVDPDLVELRETVAGLEGQPSSGWVSSVDSLAPKHSVCNGANIIVGQL